MSGFRVSQRIFKSSMQTWEELFAEAAEFASTLAPDRLINISHSCDNSEGVVCVWFWEEVPAPAE